MLPVSLGPRRYFERRKAVLDGIAARLGVTRSRVFQMIADGDLLLVVRADPPEPEPEPEPVPEPA